MASSQTKVWNASDGTVTRVGATKQGAGHNRRLYAGHAGSFNYNSWLKFAVDWTGVGKILRATLVLYTDDFLGPIMGIPPSGDTPSVRIRRLVGAFTEGNNADEVFNASDYKPGTTTSSGEVTKGMTKEANGLNRIDITSIVNAWAPAAVKRSTGGSAAPAKALGIGVLAYSSDTKRNWSGWSEEATDSSLRPFIELVYEYGATTPDVPTNLEPSGAVVSLNAFEGDFTDIRSSDLLAHSEVEVYSPSHSATVATSDVVTDTAHGLANGAQVYLLTLTGGAGLATFTRYYVRARTANTFKLATANTDASIRNVTTVGSLTWATRLYARKLPESNTAITAARFDHVPGDDLHLVKNTSYGWRARVYDNEGVASAWSSVVTFSVSNTNPDAPTLTPLTGSSKDSLDGVAFRGGEFSDPDAGDTLLAYQVQMSAYAEGAPEWDDGAHLKWDTGKRLVASGATSWETPYGGESLAAGTYHWRARQWDAHEGASDWSYAAIIVASDYVAEPEDSVNVIQLRPRAPWRILIKEMKFNAVGGNLTGVAATNLITSASAHKMAAGRRVRFSALTGGSGLSKARDYYVIASGLTSTAFRVSTTRDGTQVDFTTAITAGTVTAITTRGPGNVVAVLEDATNVGASILYNSPGEMHFTLGISHPQISVIEPKQTHYAIEFRQGDGWREVFAGLMWDFDASDTDVVFYGIDYLALLDFQADEHYDPANIEKASDKGGSKYVNRSISYIITDQLKRARENANSPVGFISTGSIATMAEQLTVYSTYQPTLNFIVGLLDSHRAGTGKRSRIAVVKTAAGAYQFKTFDDPGIIRENLRLRYGELVQGYRVIPFGSVWATRVSAVGRDKLGVKVRYETAAAPGIDETVWGRFNPVQFIDGVSDANDMVRRTKQAVVAVSKLGKNVALGLRSGVLQPRDGFDLLDIFPVDIEHGSVSTAAFGSGYWVAVGITWQALQRGDLNTTLTLHPREDTVAPDDDLLTLQEISGQSEWQVGWRPPAVVTATTAATSRYWLDQTTGKVYERTGSALRLVGITGTI